ncbi:sugar phosphate nucleotidyltransferase [Patescibacteria group bacterium]
MKTLILCGGKGTRLREETEFKPKPMVEIGGLPIVQHIMNIYSHHGHSDFVLCLGYKGSMIKDHFINLSRLQDDLELNMLSNEIKYLNNHANCDRNITFAETGEDTLTAERIKIASKYVDDDMFMITYGDGVSDVDVNALVDFHKKQSRECGTLATITAVHPSSKYGKIIADENHVIREFSEKPVLDDFINGGFMVFNKEALSYLKDGEMLEDSLRKLSEDGKLSQFTHKGFWHSMDTMKDVMDLNKLWEKESPWDFKKDTCGDKSKDMNFQGFNKEDGELLGRIVADIDEFKRRYEFFK